MDAGYNDYNSLVLLPLWWLQNLHVILRHVYKISVFLILPVSQIWIPETRNCMLISNPLKGEKICTRKKVICEKVVENLVFALYCLQKSSDLYNFFPGELFFYVYNVF
jgi:hypothetical protein